MLKVTDFGDCNDDSLKLESGPSSRFTAPRLISCRIDILIIFRIAAFNAYNNAFKIIDLMTRIPLLSVDLGQEVVDHLAHIFGFIIHCFFHLLLIYKTRNQYTTTEELYPVMTRQVWAQCSAVGSSMMETGLGATLSSLKRFAFLCDIDLRMKYPRCRSWKGLTGCLGWWWWQKRRTGRAPTCRGCQTSFLARRSGDKDKGRVLELVIDLAFLTSSGINYNIPAFSVLCARPPSCRQQHELLLT